MVLSERELRRTLKRFKKDPIPFIEECIKVVHPVHGMVPFRLYPFQRIIVKALREERFNILRKFRQAGCTTLVAAFALWLCLFHKLKTVVILSIGDTEAVEVLERIKIMYEELPDWMKLVPNFRVVEKNKHTFKFANGSIIKSRPSGRESGRGLSGSLVIFDEAAFIENMETIWKAAYPTVSTGGSVFVLSTVNGIGNWYHETWEGAVKGTNYFNPVMIDYTDHPEYVFNEDWEKEYQTRNGESFYKKLEDKGIDIHAWEDITRKQVGPRGWKQEYLCEFLGTGDTYIDGEILTQLHENVNKKFHSRWNNRLRVWAEAHPAYEYLISADPSLGRERDSTVFQVFNLYDGTQVAEFKSATTPLDVASEFLVQLGREYNNAMIVPERNSIGVNLIEHLYRLGYDGVWCDDKGHPGFQMNQASREVALAIMEEFIRTRRIKINSQRAVDELLTFIVNDVGKAEADEGCHDDLVMALAIASFAMKDVISNTPIETTLGESNDITAEMYAKSFKHSIGTPGGIEEEDLKWLIGA